MQNQQSQTGRPSRIDPSHLGDPIAMRTDWAPAFSGGASFRTRKLVRVNSNRVEFRAATGLRLVFLLMILVGVGFPVACGLDEGVSFVLIGFAFIGMVWLTAGSLLLYYLCAPIVFDKRRGFFWKNRKAPAALSEATTRTHSVKLAEIHALQLLSEYVEGEKRSYYSYELNLVLNNGDRINVTDHGDVKRLRKDTHALSTFLGKPVWDAI